MCLNTSHDPRLVWTVRMNANNTKYFATFFLGTLLISHIRRVQNSIQPAKDMRVGLTIDDCRNAATFHILRLASHRSVRMGTAFGSIHSRKTEIYGISKSHTRHHHTANILSCVFSLYQYLKGTYAFYCAYISNSIRFDFLREKIASARLSEHL